MDGMEMMEFVVDFDLSVLCGKGDGPTATRCLLEEYMSCHRICFVWRRVVDWSDGEAAHGTAIS